MLLSVLTWNVFHGRSVPGSGRDLVDEFTEALAGWDWDLALLQEVPPWWPPAIGSALHCEQRLALTSRNGLAPVRRLAARHLPDLMRSGGGGANAILSRRDRIIGARCAVLCRRPERRVAHGVALACGLWVTNLHATAHDGAAAAREVDEAACATDEWAREHRMPALLGGDLNLRSPAVTGLRVAGSSDVDHVLVGDGVLVAGPAHVLERGTLSDHAPLLVTVKVDLG